MPDQTIDRQRSGAADQDRECHKQQRQRVFDAAAPAVSLREKKTVAPVAQEKRHGDKPGKEKRRRSHEKTQRHGDRTEDLREESENSERDRYVVFLIPILKLILDAFPAMPTQCLLRAVREKRQCQAEAQEDI